MKKIVVVFLSVVLLLCIGIVFENIPNHFGSVKDEKVVEKALESDTNDSQEMERKSSGGTETAEKKGQATKEKNEQTVETGDAKKNKALELSELKKAVQNVKKKNSKASTGIQREENNKEDVTEEEIITEQTGEQEGIALPADEWE